MDGHIKIPILPRIRDRGPARHFHGRTDQRASFVRVLGGAKNDPGRGTTFLVQGPPGVGKTALLHKMAQDAAGEWDVVHIKPAALESPVVMAQTLGKTYVANREENFKAGAKILETGFAKQIAGTQTVVGALRDCLNPRDNVILVLDEAQHLANPSVRAAEAAIRDALDDITNGRTERKVVLLLGGLGNTESALEQMGLSRLERNCLHNLKGLHGNEARNVIGDWLVDVGCAAEHLASWVSVLADLADGWPQHLIICAAVAAEKFSEHSSAPTPEVIREIRDKVGKEKETYYRLRQKGLATEIIVILGLLVAYAGAGCHYAHSRLLSALGVIHKDDVGAESALAILIKKGVVAEHADDALYYIPIPSMERHLLEQASRVAAHDPGLVLSIARKLLLVLADYRQGHTPQLPTQLRRVLGDAGMGTPPRQRGPLEAEG
ncbi:MAG: AAA family ATPase [Bacteroidota bacterium]|nr:AAA family ATPase [Bacteroidota bacterium]